MIGIYKITNTLNNHSYIGLSTKLEDRWKYHNDQYNWKREKSKALYQAFQKYGIENFTFEILEESSIEELSEKEKYYVNKFLFFVENAVFYRITGADRYKKHKHRHCK